MGDAKLLNERFERDPAFDLQHYASTAAGICAGAAAVEEFFQADKILKKNR